MLVGQGAGKGIFITTSNFSKEAALYVEKNSDINTILIDGIQVTEYMID